MASSDDRQTDPVDALLAAGDALDRSEPLRGVVLARTTAVIRRRLRVKRGLLAAALVGCYLAGMATMSAWRSPERSGPAPIARQPAVLELEPSSEDVSAAEEERAVVRPRTGVSAEPQERKPRVLRKASYQDVRRLGDRYLYEQRDLSLGLRYSVIALDMASAEQQAISVEEDSWLMKALKASRMEETENDRQDG